MCFGTRAQTLKHTTAYTHTFGLQTSIRHYEHFSHYRIDFESFRTNWFNFGATHRPACHTKASEICVLSRYRHRAIIINNWMNHVTESDLTELIFKCTNYTSWQIGTFEKLSERDYHHLVGSCLLIPKPSLVFKLALPGFFNRTFWTGLFLAII